MNRFIGALLLVVAVVATADARHRRATTVVYQAQPTVSQAQPAFTPVTTFAQPVSSPTPMAVPMSGGGLAQQKAEIQARSGRCFHPGGSFGGGTHEGCGFSSVSADDAIRHCCYWGQRTPIDIGVARGGNGWYATVIYR